MAIIANSLKMTFTNLYFFKMILSSKLFPIITTITYFLTHLAFTFRWKWGNLNNSWSGSRFNLDSKCYCLGKWCITREFHNLTTSNLELVNHNKNDTIIILQLLLLLLIIITIIQTKHNEQRLRFSAYNNMPKESNGNNK